MKTTIWFLSCITRKGLLEPLSFPSEVSFLIHYKPLLIMPEFYEIFCLNKPHGGVPRQPHSGPQTDQVTIGFELSASPHASMEERGT
jgi:hypothetical protein